MAAVRLCQSQVGVETLVPLCQTFLLSQNGACNICLIYSVYCSNIAADDMLYTETDLEESMDKIETINFHEVKEVAGIKFWCYHAGHVLGAAMFMIEIAGVKVITLYSIVHGLSKKSVAEKKSSLSKCVVCCCRFTLKLLYTGDFSRQEDRHLMAAEIPSVKPDILIIV